MSPHETLKKSILSKIRLPKTELINCLKQLLRFTQSKNKLIITRF